MLECLRGNDFAGDALGIRHEETGRGASSQRTSDPLQVALCGGSPTHPLKRQFRVVDGLAMN